MFSRFSKTFLLNLIAVLLGINLSFAQYCLPTYTNPCFNPPTTNDNITNFYTTGAQINISNLNTGCTAALPNNYTYFSGMTLVVARGSSFTAHVQCAQQGGINAFAQGFKVWVDWDQNGVFENSPPAGGTQICNGGQSSGQSGFQEFQMNINVPSNIPLGTTRMRVRSAYNTVPTSPCGNETYGETEDYNVLVVDNPANPGLTIVPDTICSGQSASLSVLGVTSGTFRWYSQQSGGPLLFVGATYNTPVLTNTTSAPITQNYYVDVIVNGCPSGRLLFPVVINPVVPLQIISSESTVCVGEEFTLSTPDNFATYTWTPAAVLESPNAQSTNAVIAAETTFQL